MQWFLLGFSSLCLKTKVDRKEIFWVLFLHATTKRVSVLLVLCVFLLREVVFVRKARFISLFFFIILFYFSLHKVLLKYKKVEEVQQPRQQATSRWDEVNTDSSDADSAFHHELGLIPISIGYGYHFSRPRSRKSCSGPCSKLTN